MLSVRPTLRDVPRVCLSDVAQVVGVSLATMSHALGGQARITLSTRVQTWSAMLEQRPCAGVIARGIDSSIGIPP